MKKYIILAVFAVIAVSITLNSCKKEPVTNTDTQDAELKAFSQKIIGKIKNFDVKMKNQLKSGETMSIDSAVWNMEALQNFEYVNHDNIGKDIEVVKSNYTINLDNNGNVLLNDVQTVYAQMDNSLNTSMNQIPTDEKALRAADVALDSITGNTAHLSVRLIIDKHWLLNKYWGFSASDDWLWGTLGQESGTPPLGKCDGTAVGVSDASDELQWRLNNPVVLPHGNYIYIDQVTYEAVGWDFEDENYNPRLFMNFDYNWQAPDCLTNDMLTYYLIQSDKIINNYDEGLRPANKSFVNVVIADTQIVPDYAPPMALHYYAITYGTFVNLGDSY